MREKQVMRQWGEISVAGIDGKVLNASPRSKSFQFHAVFGKFLQNHMLAKAPSPARGGLGWGGVGAPTSGKSWVTTGIYWFVTTRITVTLNKKKKLGAYGFWLSAVLYWTTFKSEMSREKTFAIYTIKNFMVTSVYDIDYLNFKVSYRSQWRIRRGGCRPSIW